MMTAREEVTKKSQEYIDTEDGVSPQKRIDLQLKMLEEQ